MSSNSYKFDSIIFSFLQNNIPVFCPGLTDGSLGDMLYFHSFRNPGLVIDIVQGKHNFLCYIMLKMYLRNYLNDVCL